MIFDLCINGGGVFNVVIGIIVLFVGCDCIVMVMVECGDMYCCCYMINWFDYELFVMYG